MTESDELQGQSDDVRLPDITYRPGYNKLDSYNWLQDLPENQGVDEIIEIRFKNTRKGFYRNVNASGSKRVMLLQLKPHRT